MENKDFGQLVAIFRKESLNEFDNPMTQNDLADLARIPLITLQKIEQGRQVNIKADLLINLAEALNLNSQIAQTFFLSSLGIKANKMSTPSTTPQAVLDDLTQVLSNLQNPAFIIDSFGDILVINQSLMTVYNLEASQLHAPHLLSQYNINRLYFSPELEGIRKMMGNIQFDYLHRAILLFKWLTLKVRNHWFFLQLLPELNRFPIFRDHWQSHFSNEEDLFAQYKILSLNHPSLGQITFLSTPNHAITTEGDLSLFSFQPMDTHTAEVCCQLARKYDSQLIQLGSWPKPPIPAGLLMK